MAEQLAAVPEESTTIFPAPYPLSSSYGESIRTVDGPEWRIRPSLFPQFGHSGSSYSGSSNISGYSSGFVSGLSAGVSGFGAGEIAHKMVSDGYLQQMVQAFSGQDPDSVLAAWFSELDVPWVLLHSRGEIHGSLLQLQLQELVEKWIRSLTLIVLTIKELVAADHETPAVARFGKASISVMLDFVHTLNLSKPENLQAMLHMYVCVSSASYDMYMMRMSHPEAQSIFREIRDLLDRKEDELTEAISGMITGAKIKAFSNVDDSWDIEILRGRGEVHRGVRMLVDCIVSMRKAKASSQDSAQSHNDEKLRDLIGDTMGYLKNMLQEKSEMCLDPSLRYMFLLNNSNFVAQEVSEPSIRLDSVLGHIFRLSYNLAAKVSEPSTQLQLTPECEKHMDSYLEVSWGHVLSCISTPKISGPFRRWNKTSSLTKFHSAFHKTYQAQKFWKVPDPDL